MKFDSNGNKLEESRLDRFGVGLDNAITRFSYNKQNKVISRSFYDADGVAMVDSLGIHAYKEVYRGKLKTQTSYHNQYNAPTALAGIAKINYKHDKRGNVMLVKHFDKNQALVEDSTGVAITKYTCDAYDRVSREVLFNEQGKLASKNGLYAIVVYVRDRSGNILEKTYYDEIGHLTHDEDSISHYQYSYNRNGYNDESVKYTVTEAIELGVNKIKIATPEYSLSVDEL
jgi:hypothetical protein